MNHLVSWRAVILNPCVERTGNCGQLRMTGPACVSYPRLSRVTRLCLPSRSTGSSQPIGCAGKLKDAPSCCGCAACSGNKRFPNPTNCVRCAVLQAFRSVVVGWVANVFGRRAGRWSCQVLGQRRGSWRPVMSGSKTLRSPTF